MLRTRCKVLWRDEPSTVEKHSAKRNGSLLEYALNARCPNRNLFTGAAQAYARIGPFLLSLTAVLLVTAPLTQHVWTWDHFLSGGQDYESSTLLILAFLCLVLVLAQHCKQNVSLLFAARRQSSFLPRDTLSTSIALRGPLSIFPSEQRGSPSLEMSNPPLQI